jgi:plastocyanin
MRSPSTKSPNPSSRVRHARRAATIGACVVAVAGLAGCSSSSGASKGGATKSSTQDQVTLKLVALHPARLTVAPGATVTWKQTDPGVHTVTSGTVEDIAGGVSPKPDGQFDSGELSTRKTFTHTFSKPGTYPYFCKIHPATMRGVITVR